MMRPFDERCSFKQLFDDLPVAATVVDERGRILYENKEARRLAGAGPEVVTGVTCRQYWRCSIAPCRCPLRRVLSRNRPVYRARVAEEGSPGKCVIERISPFEGSKGRRHAVILTSPATAFFRRMRALRRQASRDGLTGVLNRGGFDRLTGIAWRRERRRKPSAFLMMDVDGLKLINDCLGHAAGDEVLRRLGRILIECSRRTDVVGRVGGDEFAVYCPHTDRKSARALSLRIQAAIRRDNVRNAGKPYLKVQVGLACAEKGFQEALRAEADRRLYAQKARSHPETLLSAIRAQAI